MASETMESPVQSSAFTIFRLEDGQPLPKDEPKGLTEVSAAGLARLREAGLGEGADVRILYDGPGFSLIYVWFKSGFPLFRHSHSPECLYQVTGGSLQIGDQVLRKGDGFFLPADAPYTYTVGPEGVELLEFRRESLCDTTVHANNPAFWTKAAEVIESSLDRWRTEQPPL